jgi:hypothetical protein
LPTLRSEASSASLVVWSNTISVPLITVAARSLITRVPIRPSVSTRASPTSPSGDRAVELVRGCHAVVSLPKVLGRQHERPEAWQASAVGRLETDAGGLADEAIGQAIEMRTSVPEPQRNTKPDQRVNLVD